MTDQTAETKSANISQVQAALRGNAQAANTFRVQSERFGVETINSAVAGFLNLEEEREKANKTAQQAEATALALITGLMLEVMPNWDKWQASEAASDYTRPYFNRRGFLHGQSAELKQVYLSREKADSYTQSIAPERVLVTDAGMTLYLFSEADARLFTERTGQTLKPY